MFDFLVRERIKESPNLEMTKLQHPGGLQNHNVLAGEN